MLAVMISLRGHMIVCLVILCSLMSHVVSADLLLSIVLNAFYGCWACL